MNDIKELADEILKLTSLYTIDIACLKFFIESGIYKENAEKRLYEIITEDIDDAGMCPPILQFKASVLVVTQVLDKEDQEDLVLSASEKWLFKD